MDDIYVEEEIVKSSDEIAMDIDLKHDLSISLPSFTGAVDPLAPTVDDLNADDGGNFDDEDSKVNIDRLKEELEESLNNQEERDPLAESSSSSKVKDKKKEKSKKELEEEEREKMQVLVSNFTEDQLNHYEMFRRAAFPKAAIKRVAPSTEYVTMGVLFAEPTQDVTLARLKALAKDFLPEGWEDWKVVRGGEGSKLSSAKMNLVRFALPTEGIVRAFDPAAVSLKSHDYLVMKRKMLKWPFCQGLVYHPSELSLRFRKLDDYLFFLNAILPVEDRLIGRALANQLLAKTPKPLEASSNQGGSVEQVKALCPTDEVSVEVPKPLEASSDIHAAPGASVGQIGVSSSSDEVPADTWNPLESLSNEDEVPDDIRERIEALEVRMAKVEGNQAKVLDKLCEGSFSHLAELVPSTRRNSSSASSSADPPKPNSATGSIFDDLFFEPRTIVDPGIPEPSPEIQAAGIRCQKLNSPAWNNIAYEEAKRALEVGGVFKALEVNPELMNYVEDPYSKQLEDMDTTLGMLTNGLLLQHQALGKVINRLTRRHPEAGRSLQRKLTSANAPFRQTSDDLLQYVCAKRSEVIMCRRKLLESSTDLNPEVLQNIPPSDQFLFEPRQLAEAIRQHELANIDSGPPARFEKRPTQTFHHAAKRMRRSRDTSERPGGRR